jgi:lipoate-protein ligase B
MSEKRHSISVSCTDKAYAVDLGLISYAAAYDLQIKIVEAKKEGVLNRDVFLILEHPPVFTLGLRGGTNHLKVTEAFLTERDIPLVRTERGGFITYHGPGQIVVYPIVYLPSAGLSVVSFVEILEEIMIRISLDWGIEVRRKPPNRGVWAGNQKIGSVGVAVRRSIGFHGLALNVNTELEPFHWIDPCGLEGVEVSSLKEIKHSPIPCTDIIRQAKIHIRNLFEKDLEMISPTDLEKLLSTERNEPL